MICKVGMCFVTYIFCYVQPGLCNVYSTTAALYNRDVVAS